MTSEQPLAQSVATILATQLDIALEQVVPRACLFVDLRALPLALVRASLALEEAFGVVIPDESLADVRTVGDFIALVARHSSPSAAHARSASAVTSSPHLPEATSHGGRARTRAPRRIRRGRWA